MLRPALLQPLMARLWLALLWPALSAAASLSDGLPRVSLFLLSYLPSLFRPFPFLPSLGSCSAPPPRLSVSAGVCEEREEPVRPISGPVSVRRKVPCSLRAPWLQVLGMTRRLICCCGVGYGTISSGIDWIRTGPPPVSFSQIIM